jgi:hypothetical protein
MIANSVVLAVMIVGLLLLSLRERADVSSPLDRASHEQAAAPTARRLSNRESS